MKKTSYFYIIIFCVAAIISLIYYICFINFNNGNNTEVPNITDYPHLDTVEGAKKDSADSIAAAKDNVQKSEYVTDSSVAGYMMKSDGDNVSLFEIYENGYSEKIKTLDINPKLLREVDRAELGVGIERDTYAEICSLIEDFSS